MRRNIFICLLLAGVTLAIYWPVRHYGIIYYDDPYFISETPEINAGLNGHSLAWAFTGVVLANWHPATNLTFLFTHQFWGANPGVEHLANAIFHALNAVLLFLVLTQMMSLRHDDPQQPYDLPPRNANKTVNAAITATTPQADATWRSAVVAAIFAWHPLRVESVAWIAERKDVLCGFFFMLTLLCYARYAQCVTSDACQVTGPGKAMRAPLRSRVTCHVSLYYWLVLLFFALGLMSKPMLVTLPFVLLLLDFWPLGRVTSGKWRVTRLGYASARQASGKNSVAQLLGATKRSEGGSTLNHLLFEKWPFFTLSAIFSGLTYLVQKNSAGVVPWTNIGLGDRLGNAATSYLKYLGKTIWPTDLAVIYPYPKSQDELAVWLTALWLLAVSIFCVGQLQRRPYLAVGWFWYLGTLVPVIGLVQAGEQAMADRYTYIPLIGPVISLVWLVAEFFQSRKILLSAAAVIVPVACVGLTVRQVQCWRNTIALFEHNVTATPENASAHFTLGLGLEHAGDTNRAIVCYRVATAITPRDKEAHQNLASLLRQQGHLAAARDEYNTLLVLDQNDFSTHLSLAGVLAAQGRTDESLHQLQEAVRLNPDSVEALNNLAWMLATSPDASIRDGTQAVQLVQRACELMHYQKTIYIGTLAAAYAEAGRFDDAMATAQKAIALAQQNGEKDLLRKNRELLELYRHHKAYRESAESR